MKFNFNFKNDQSRCWSKYQKNKLSFQKQVLKLICYQLIHQRILIIEAK